MSTEFKSDDKSFSTLHKGDQKSHIKQYDNILEQVNYD